MRILLALAILNNSAPMKEEVVLDGTLIDLSGILTIQKGNESLLSKRPNQISQSFILMSKFKKIASYL